MSCSACGAMVTRAAAKAGYCAVCLGVFERIDLALCSGPISRPFVAAA